MKDETKNKKAWLMWITKKNVDLIKNKTDQKLQLNQTKLHLTSRKKTETGNSLF